MKHMLAALALLGAAILPAQAEEVGKVGVDWLGNDIVIDAVADPKIQGVTCHLASFSRGVIDRLQKGNWFEDPSNASISCQQTGPIVIGDIKLGEGGERVFSERTSLIWKKLNITRIYDKQNNSLIYLAHASQVQDGSAKTSISTIPLFAGNVTWTKGKPE
ncbi:CreA family protein [Phyllobacterium sp. 22229]|uniref:CreA family protein n=1 Tax=Phyllobacterium myrsinacearum TaxID=28101 RepID=A0A2S9JXC7_9HYPH|nr:CreA family protein [Phyllobacterium myrsinacearum]PRD57976.1 CreA family protein [Phyllobacterium myrsinacearum]PWV96154.1 CreA protein [Phyllobacterium myrsinacearum]RZS83436.1 CreA protein [Phyllobacterium myrsinacearum]RZV09856.1 CreA protein [Phyllobacterium myrsinacearum]